MTLAPSTVQGRPTGPTISGQAHLLDDAGRRRVRRLLQPGGRLLWSYLLYRIRGHRMRVYEVRFADRGVVRNRKGATRDATPIRGSNNPSSEAQVNDEHRAGLPGRPADRSRFGAAVRRGAGRLSVGPARRTSVARLYLAFMAVHAIHFTVVSTYARINGGRDLFPGGRSLNQAGGWPTVVSIYAVFSSLALTGWAAGGPLATTHPKIGTSDTQPPGSSQRCSSAPISDGSPDRRGTQYPPPPWPGR